MWAQIASAVLGIWFMVSPALIDGFTETTSANNRIFGPLVVAFSVIAIWEVMRSVRFGSTIVAAWLLVACLVLGYRDMALVTNAIAAMAVIGLSLVRGTHDPLKFGGGWMSLFNDEMWEKGQASAKQGDS